MQELVYLGLGSNRDNRLWYLFQALRYFNHTPFIKMQKISSIYETEPYGITNQRDFLNAVVEIQTSFTPGKLLQYIKFIEKKVGRIERGFWESREIDIDILTFSEKQIRIPWLNIPHIELHKRRFVLVPFAEISPDLFVPRFNRPVQNLLDHCKDEGRVQNFISRFELEEQYQTTATEERIFN